MGVCNDLVLDQISRLVNAWMLRKVTRRSHYYPTHLADPYRDQSRVGKVAYAERKIDALVD